MAVPYQSRVLYFHEQNADLSAKWLKHNKKWISIKTGVLADTKWHVQYLCLGINDIVSYYFFNGVFIRWVLGWLDGWLVDWFIGSFTFSPSFMSSCVRACVRSFFRSFRQNRRVVCRGGQPVG